MQIIIFIINFEKIFKDKRYIFMDITNIFRSKGIKVTPQRRAVYKVLDKLRHCSVEDVVEAVTVKHPSITVSTVYNILDCFAENGIISRLSTTKGKLYYDITPLEHHHIITDNNIIDYQDEGLSKLISEYISQHPIEGYDIDKISLQVYVKTQYLK